MPESRKRKARATRLEFMLDIMDDLARRVAEYEGQDAANILVILTAASERWAKEPPTKKPRLRTAMRPDLTKGATAVMIPNSEWELVNPLQVTEDATTGRPTRVQVVDSQGTPAFIEAKFLQVARKAPVPVPKKKT